MLSANICLITMFLVLFLDVHMNSSCSHRNGGCKHICLATPKGHRCVCPDGMKMAANGTNCLGMLMSVEDDVRT